MTPATSDVVDADLAAADVAWDLEPLVDGDGEPGADRLFDEAERRARDLAKYRGRIAEIDAGELAALMHELAGISELAARAGNYAGLRFAVDTQDPANGALVARAEERETAIANELIFVELEWAELDDERTSSLLADDRLAFCRHHLASARRYRPHLLTEPEERVLADKSLTASGAWVRFFSELTSAIRVDVDGDQVSLEEGLSRLQSPDRSVRQRAAA